ncbi:MAG: hypothetical protein LCH79_01460 [Proteobacteria bacterium]|nr:hypothetical protein [Pseudomonadota bacterium]
MKPLKPVACLLSCVSMAMAVSAPALAAPPAAQALQARYAEYAPQLADNDFQRAMHIESAAAGNSLSGEIHAVLDHPFKRLSSALREPTSWCDVLILPFNTKFCRATTGGGAAGGQPVLAMRIGRKFDQPLKDAYPLDLRWQRVAATPEYFETRLTAAEGPVGTRDYRVVVAAVPLEGGRTFMRLSYSYSYGTMGRLALQGYLATAGADKVGFSVKGRDASGAPVYVDGMRGVVERNAMRYYLAIDAYLASLAAPPHEQVERRIQAWFNASERHARQLREMDRATYVELKRSETERQRAAM